MLLMRYGIANTIFDFINSFDCSLISASINKVSHDAKYEWPVNVRAYTLLICLERFQFFLEEKNSEGLTGFCCSRKSIVCDLLFSKNQAPDL